MTAVLSATDALRKDRHLSLDDNQFDYSSAQTDWRAKYHEVLDMLAETRNELEEFQAASKELEAEMEADLQRSEKLEQELRGKVAKADKERDEWKGKYITLQTTHNTTTTSLQRELDKLRQEHQQIKIQLRELEMGNDDLERNERAVSSSLADMETKYAKALEEKILLEHELLEKASLEEEMQRLKDELRDSQDEVAILKEQLTSATVSVASASASVEKLRTSETMTNSLQQFPQITIPSEDDLLHTPLPRDLQLSELSSPTSESPPSINATPKAHPTAKTSGQSLLLNRAGFHPTKSSNLPSTSPGITHSTTLPSLHSPRIPLSRPPVATGRNVSLVSTASTSSTTSAKNKGVQMVSEMRARVRVLEQKIHTRVPRLRMASLTGRANATVTPVNALASSSSSSSFGSVATTAKTSLDSIRRSGDSRKSNDSAPKKDSGDSSGWVLIMEDSPSPQKPKPKDRQKETRRLSSPAGPSAFRSTPPGSGITAPSPTFGKSAALAQSTGIRRPQSRLSGASLSTATTGSSIPTPVSRPTTPTFLPIPTSSLYANSSGIGLKRSTGPGGSLYSGAKRASLGVSTNIPVTEPHRDRPITMPPLPRPGSSTPSSTTSSKYDEMKSLPQLPSQLHQNITIRQTKLPSSSSALSKSRIGKPGTGRKSAGDSGVGYGDVLDVKDLLPRTARES